MPAEYFALAYEGRPPWDIGRPQGAFRCLVEAGQIHGSVLDVGCGTGENALYLAAEGLAVTGVDAAELAVHKATTKARRRRLGARFAVHDALHLESLGSTFDTVVDSGLFHTFDDGERLRFRASLAAVLRPGGHYFMLCFSERETGEGGPRRVTQREIHEVFDGNGFVVQRIDPALLETRGDGGRQAWLAVIRRVSGEPGDAAGAAREG